MENKEERQEKKIKARVAHPEIILLLIRSTAGEEREMEEKLTKEGLESSTALVALTALITTRLCGMQEMERMRERKMKKGRWMTPTFRERRTSEDSREMVWEMIMTTKTEFSKN